MSARKRAPSTPAAPETKHPGSNGLRPEHVADIQRVRLLAAMTAVSAERGAGNVTVAHVVERAGVSRRTFYELFTDREDCFLAALDSAIGQVSGAVLAGYDPSAKWSERIRGALVNLLAFLDASPGAGRLLIVESLGAGPKALERRERVLARVIATVAEGQVAGKAASGLPAITAEGIVGAVLSVLHARMVEGAAGPLLDLVNPLMSMIVLPYLGPAAARRELDRPVPELGPRQFDGASNPLRELQIRLTYRTVRVLLAVGARPGGSNRGIAEHAGITDQGQISKLLSRLQKLGLIVNTDLASSRGAPNAWTLTDKGREVHSALSG